MQCKKKVEVAGFPDSYVGVGLELRIEHEVPVVVQALSGGPGENAGIQAGDRIVDIEGHSTVGATLGNVVMQLRGAPNSKVQLTLERQGRKMLVVVQRTSMRKGGRGYQPEGG